MPVPDDKNKTGSPSVKSEDLPNAPEPQPNVLARMKAWQALPDAPQPQVDPKNDLATLIRNSHKLQLSGLLAVTAPLKTVEHEPEPAGPAAPLSLINAGVTTGIKAGAGFHLTPNSRLPSQFFGSETKAHADLNIAKGVTLGAKAKLDIGELHYESPIKNHPSHVGPDIGMDFKTDLRVPVHPVTRALGPDIVAGIDAVHVRTDVNATKGLERSESVSGCATVAHIEGIEAMACITPAVLSNTSLDKTGKRATEGFGMQFEVTDHNKLHSFEHKLGGLFKKAFHPHDQERS